MSTLAATVGHLSHALMISRREPTGRRDTVRTPPAALLGDHRDPSMPRGALEPAAAAPIEDATLFTYWVAG
ncbi:MAG: hypothetical protein ACOYLQ_09730 [Hyphomicrobiaceae bacterium]